ncbi:uncharacterized protein LOC123538578 isoform X2 [Mercenaria mercenaria]|uniref:uncharacterized protein LOC123538578 isoform X2 n=1 Tax=Mercenaria mercenaria TaxID=6596 RepID=UPI00234EDF22|nr:uncharacterized protein LOC123538578 isoform X2 [Mercenaria mercenaria]
MNTAPDSSPQHKRQGCEYGDRVDQCNVDNGRRCYDANIRRDCCSTCQSYETSVPGCRYGDKVSNCKETECPNYSPQRLANCCDTCYTGTWSSTSSSTDNLVTSGTSESSGVPGWTVPVAASIGGVLVLVIVIVVVVLCRRNKKSDNLSPIDDQMYNEYKLSKRAPMAPPRHPSTEKGWVDESKETDYAYISPDHVEGPQSNARRTGSDPLPPTPAEYLDLTDAHTVASDYDSSWNNDVSHDVQNHDRATSNKYEKFPGSSAYVNQPENGDVSYKL